MALIRIFPHLVLVLLPFVFQTFLPSYAVIGWIFAFCIGLFTKTFAMSDRSLVIFILYAFLGGMTISLITGQITPSALTLVFMILGAASPDVLSYLHELLSQKPSKKPNRD